MPDQKTVQQNRVNKAGGTVPNPARKPGESKPVSTRQNQLRALSNSTQTNRSQTSRVDTNKILAAELEKVMANKEPEPAGQETGGRKKRSPLAVLKKVVLVIILAIVGTIATVIITTVLIVNFVDLRK